MNGHRGVTRESRFEGVALRREPAGHHRVDLPAAEIDAQPQLLLRQLGEMIRSARVAMLTSVSEHGHLRSRPMITQQSELDDELWFYIDARSGLIDDITDEHQVNLVYVDPRGQSYASISGIGHVVRDTEALRRFWNSEVAKWFPDGPDGDPHLALLRVQLEEVEWWEGSGSKVAVRGLARSGEREAPNPKLEPPYEAPTEGP